MTVGNRRLGSLYCLCFGFVEWVLSIFIMSVITKIFEIFESLVLNISKPLFFTAMTQDHAKHGSTLQPLFGYRILSSETGSSRALEFQQTISEKKLPNGYRQRGGWGRCSLLLVSFHV